MSDSSTSIVEFLKDPASYPDRPGSVRMVETHISWVFLTDRHAYKLKKPVKFEFVDFSSLESRHRDCLDELRLNRRLAPDVYLDVLPVIDAEGQFVLGGEGPVVDWVVRMRRLPAELALDVQMKAGKLTSSQESAIAEYLAGFYPRLSPVEISADAYCHRLEHNIRANATDLIEGLPAERPRLRRLHGLQLRYLHLEREVFERRVQSGRIVEGHGDLRPEHIYLETPPVVIDCLEFSETLRQVDVADELGFLDMECQRLGNTSLGSQVLTTYERASGDALPPKLLDFYRSYRACVRAKVAVLRQQQAPADNGATEVYLQLAERFAATLGAPAVLIVGGLSGTGKSTLARAVAEALGADLFSTDSIRRAQMGASDSPAAFGEGHYRPERRAQVYETMLSEADRALADGLSVVLDGTFLSREQRERVYELAARQGAVSLFVLCQCQRETALARITARRERGEGDSEARAEFYDKQLEAFEPPGSDEPVVAVETTQPIRAQQRRVFDELRKRAFLEAPAP